MQINNVDICCGLAWGDEAKGKIVSQLIKIKNMILYVVGMEEVMQDTLYILTEKNFIVILFHLAFS